jgi:hypothetical protein
VQQWVISSTKIPPILLILRNALSKRYFSYLEPCDREMAYSLLVMGFAGLVAKTYHLILHRSIHGNGDPVAMVHWISRKETFMVLEKRQLSLEEIEAQTALELPDRETLATVIIGCLALCVGQIQIKNVSVAIADQVCIAVQALNVTLLGLTGTQLSCTHK